jgi:hypothetical protein
MCLRPASGFGRRFLVNPGARLLLARAINGSVNGARSGCANTPALACDHILTCRCAFCYHAAPSGRRFHHRRRVRHLGRRRCRGIFGTVTATSHATALAAGHRTAAAGLGAPAPPADAPRRRCYRRCACARARRAAAPARHPLFLWVFVQAVRQPRYGRRKPVAACGVAPPGHASAITACTKDRHTRPAHRRRT